MKLSVDNMDLNSTSSFKTLALSERGNRSTLASETKQAALKSARNFAAECFDSAAYSMRAKRKHSAGQHFQTFSS